MKKKLNFKHSMHNRDANLAPKMDDQVTPTSKNVALELQKYWFDQMNLNACMEIALTEYTMDNFSHHS